MTPIVTAFERSPDRRQRRGPFFGTVLGRVAAAICRLWPAAAWPARRPPSDCPGWCG